MVNVVSRFRLSKDRPDEARPRVGRADHPVREPAVLEPRRRHHLLRAGRLPVRHPRRRRAGRRPEGERPEPQHALRQDSPHRRRQEGRRARTTRSRRTTRSSATKDAQPEIWAYGIRNLWRMAFDKKTGKLWAGEVGQNLYEEINIIEKGGNYGWNRARGVPPVRAEGRRARRRRSSSRSGSTTTTSASRSPAATVYRGKVLPELDGHYVYADYVSSQHLGAEVRREGGRVIANRPIKDPAKPVLSFGEDEQGEMYFLTVAPRGRASTGSRSDFSGASLCSGTRSRSIHDAPALKLLSPLAGVRPALGESRPPRIANR